MLWCALALTAWITQSPGAVAAVFGALVGAALGSFATQATYRLPRRIPLDDPPSACPACGVPIPARHNVPVLGWLLLRGRCGACRVPIPVRYLLLELAGAAGGAWACRLAAEALIRSAGPSI
ncbi:MAG: prepilin peptidase [Burkholderiales bacterium]